MSDHVSINFDLEESGGIEFPVKEIQPNTERGIQDKVDQALFFNPEFDEDALRSDFENGEEERVDDFVADSLRLQESRTRLETVNAVALSEDVDKSGLIQEIATAPVSEFKNGLARGFAKKMTVEMAVQALFDPKPEERETPQVILDAMNIQEELTAKNVLVRDWFDKRQKEWDDKSFLSKTGSTLYSMIPLVNQGALLLGGELDTINLEESLRTQIEDIMRLPNDQMLVALDAAVEQVRFLGGDLAALEFAQKFISYTSSEGFFDNVFLALDILPFIRPFKIAKGAVKGVAKLSSRATSAVLKHGADVGGIANDLGHAKTSAVNKVSKQTGATRTVDEVSDMLPTVYSVKAVQDRLTSNSNSAIRKLSKAVFYGGDQLVQPLSKVDRLSLAKTQFDRIEDYLGVRDSILDMAIIPASKGGGLDTMVLKFGKMNGEKFGSEEGANIWKKRYLSEYGDVKAVQDGDTWTLELTRNITHGKDLQDITLVADRVTPEFNTRLARFLSSDAYKTSVSTTTGRRAVASNIEKTNQLLEEAAQPLLNLNKKEVQQLEEILSEIATVKDPALKRRRFLSDEEFELRYNELFNSLPSSKIRDAYSTYTYLSDLDYVMNAGSLLATKGKLGVEKFTLPGGEEFQGIQRLSLRFWDEDIDTRILQLDGNGKVIRLLSSGKNKFTPAKASEQTKLDDLLEENWVLIESHGGGVKVGDGYATHILSKSFVRNNLSMEDALGFNPGGHLIYKHNKYIKQANITTSAGRRYLTGDTTIANVYSSKQGVEIAEALEEARRLDNLGEVTAFKKHMEDKLPGFSKNDWARVNKDVPFELVEGGQSIVGNPRNQKIWDVDVTQSDYNTTSQLKARFSGEQDDQLVSALISEQGVIKRVDKAELVRPISALQIGLRNAVDQHTQMAYVTRAADDYKREFSKYLEGSENALARNPVAAMHEPKFLPNTPQHIKDQALEVSKVTNTFLGMPTDSSVRLSLLKDKISNLAFDTDSKFLKFADERLLHLVKDPAVFFRSLAFHSKLGLFNPVQMFVQSQAVTQVASIGGVKEAMLGGVAYMLTHGLKLTADPKMLKSASKKAEVLGWNKGDFEISHKALMDSGDDIIGGSNAVRDNLEGVSITSGVGAKFLKHSTYFYNKGEQVGRVVGWHTAFLNWRKLNPKGKFDAEAFEFVRLRASDLTNNMTRDMNSTWQRGFLSVPTQFWGFQARMFEQMMSTKSRLTAKERVRLFSGMSMMYGLPVGLGAATQFLNVRESVDEYILENDLRGTVDESFILKTLTEGVLASSISFITGLNFDTTRLGPAGNPVIQDVLNDDKKIYEVFGGPAGSMIGKMITKGAPMLGAMIDSSNYNSTDTSMFSVDALTFLSGLEVSSVSQTVKLIRALNTGKYVSNNNTFTADIKPSEAFATFFTGLPTQNISDAYTSTRIKKAYQKEIRFSVKQATIEYQRSREAIDRGDEAAWRVHTNRALVLGMQGGLTSSQMGNAYTNGFFATSLSESGRDFLNNVYRQHIQRLETRRVE